MEVHQLERRALARDAGRHRRGDDDRRPAEARAALRRRRGRSASPTATASPTSTSRALIAFHREQGALATVTAVQPPGRFGALDVEGDARARASRRSRAATAAGSTAASSCSRPRSVDYIDGDETVWEQRAAASASPRDGQLAAYRHDGFWQPMDTLRDTQPARGAVGARARRRGRSGSERRASTPPSGAAGACC